MVPPPTIIKSMVLYPAKIGISTIQSDKNCKQIKYFDCADKMYGESLVRKAIVGINQLNSTIG